MPYPIMMLVYNRKDHAKKTVECLAKNLLADESDLYIFSDMAKNDENVDKVNSVREYIKTITGFKSVTIIEWETNKGVFQSTLDSCEYMCNLSEAFVGIEDDIETSPYFLKYINEALIYYKDNKDVVVATSYLHQSTFDGILNSHNYTKDVMMTEAFHSYGWGTWCDKWRSIDLRIDKPFNSKQTPANMFKYAHAGFRTWGEYYSSAIANGEKSNLWDIRLAMWMYDNKKYCVWPRYSYTRNFGFDGTGIHPWILITDLFNFSIKKAKKDTSFTNDAILPDYLAAQMAIKLGMFWVFSFAIDNVIKLFKLPYHGYDSKKDDELLENQNQNQTQLD